jgi:hypothetical protein
MSSAATRFDVMGWRLSEGPCAQPFSARAPHPRPFSSPSPLGAGRTENALPSSEPLAQRTGRGVGVRAIVGEGLG